MVPLLGALLTTMAATSYAATNYDDAVARLHTPATWCDGAAALVKIGRPDALVPLLAAYETHAETPRLCLLEAMKSLGHAGAPQALWSSGDTAAKRAALRTMGLSPEARWLPTLESAVADPRWESEALHALSLQLRDAAWESTLGRLLTSPSRAVRAEAIHGLSGRKGSAAKAALQNRVGQEKDPDLARQLVEALGT